MTLRKHTIVILITSLSFAVCAAGAYGAALYIMKGYQTKLASEQERIAAGREEGYQRVELARAAEQIESQRAELQEYFIAEEDIVSFLESIETLGYARGAVVSTASLEIVEKNSRVNELHISVKASGTLFAVQHVLTLLEELPYKSQVTRAHIERKGAVENGGEWEGTFEVTVAQYTG